ncbi:4-alpha-glucanotransferase [Streptomyces albipurpureus]|uniref:4-alpha-glucanotransferase n=1 Tax=Streptomyces albipurpureus TaxID=2897419 RepID=A0ABT0UV43_9ACTN|nr:4-alpha-glucanotransferase [Streptomyces sp. CWNU-1]MCM2391985.1 4-alpha-glucanotransferase [Streptomyces sp. CWNU-1]
MGLARLAALYGVATAYSPSEGVTVPVPEATVIAVLAALGIDAAGPAQIRSALDRAESAAAKRLLPPTVVCWQRTTAPGESGEAPGSGPPVLARLPEGTALWITLEGEPTAAPQGPDPRWDELPHGVHRLRAETPDGRTAHASLIIAPASAPLPPRRAHGFLVQLYSLLSQRSWGMGDLGDLAELASWSGRSLGAGFLQINPLHSAVPAKPGGRADPSPYRPSSRLFPDPVQLRIEDIPEYAYVSGPDRQRLDLLCEKAARLRESVLDKGALIDRDAVWALKRSALESVLRVPLGPGRRADYCDFLAERGRALDDHATWCALAEVHGPDWHSWPAELRDPRSPRTARAGQELRERVEFHSKAAWLTDRQLIAAEGAARAAGMSIGVIHDLAVGVHPGGADVWAQPEVFAAGMSVGAPPDAFNGRGQGWGLPPWRPDALAASGYAPYRELLRGVLRYAGGVRIDHVMGLFRLWWVPEGSPPTDGTYVRYDAEAMLAILVLEADRAGAIVLGEDLGTVEQGVRETLARRGVLGTSVLWFERDWAGGGRPLPPDAWREGALATVTTHDLPSTAARLTGAHTELRARLGLLTRPLDQERSRERADVHEWLRLLQGLRLLPEGTNDEEGQIRAVHRFLLRTPARLIGVWLPDAVGDRRPQNVPGTCDEYPNWRLPVADAEGHPVTLEEFASSPRTHALMEVFANRRPPGVRPPR